LIRIDGDLECFSESVLARVGYVEESILILVFLINATHERGGGWQDLINEDEDGLLWGELDALADYVDELAYCQVGWDEVLLLIDGRDVRFLNLLADDWNTVGVLLSNALGLCPSLLEDVLVLEL